MTSTLFAMVRKQTLYITSVINLHLFSFVLVSIPTIIQYHHRYKITDSGKPRTVLKAREFSLKSHAHFYVCSDLPQQNSHASCIVLKSSNKNVELLWTECETLYKKNHLPSHLVRDKIIITQATSVYT